MRKALTYFFAFIALNFTLQWATFAVWLMSAGSSFADVKEMFTGKTKIKLNTKIMNKKKKKKRKKKIKKKKKNVKKVKKMTFF